MDSPTQPEAAAFSGLIDLASERLGGQAVLANDEFFAPKENLLKPSRGVFLPDEYTDRGKWMDGWETRRRRTPGHDWCIIKLGAPSMIRGVDIDTNHFLGNFPESASLDACAADTNASAELLATFDGIRVFTLIVVFDVSGRLSRDRTTVAESSLSGSTRLLSPITESSMVLSLSAAASIARRVS